MKNLIKIPMVNHYMTTDASGNYRGAYTYADGERISVEDLGQVEGVPNDPLYYLYDALGSTIAITNMNAGIIDNNRFAPYGEALSPVAKNSRLTNSPWGYTGESHDIEAGLVYLRARYYEPGTARFIQQDSYPYFGEVQKPLTRNLYIYGNTNPLLFTDPGGNYSVKEDKVAHEQFQGYFTKMYGKSKVFKDFSIYQPFLPRTMNKKADLVLSKRGTVEVYEIEAYNKSGSGRKSLNSIVKGLKDNRIHVIKGTTYKRQGKKLVLSYPGNSKKQIEYYTKPNDPGMIYYKIVSKEGTGNRVLNMEGNKDVSGEIYNYVRDNIKSAKNNHKFDSELEGFKIIYKNNYNIYKQIADSTGVPPEVIAAIHYRESTCDFDTYLHNGQKLGTKTTIDPKGVFFKHGQFVEAAVDAIKSKQSIINRYKLTSNSTDFVAMVAFATAYNGDGYIPNGHTSPYIFSGTNLYTKGKYGSDSKYDPNLVDKQPGFIY